MIFSSLLLAISSSMDSLGIGITYGLKRIKLKKWDKLILFCVSIFVTLISILIGNILKNIFSKSFFKILGVSILIIMGLVIITKKNYNECTFDLDNSNDIDYKEAMLLGFALSLDSLCIGVGAFALGINMFLFALIVACLQYLFLTIGNLLGIHLSNLKNIPQNIWPKISGLILILIGFLKL